MFSEKSVMPQKFCLGLLQNILWELKDLQIRPIPIKHNNGDVHTWGQYC